MIGSGAIATTEIGGGEEVTYNLVSKITAEGVIVSPPLVDLRLAELWDSEDAILWDDGTAILWE